MRKIIMTLSLVFACVVSLYAQGNDSIIVRESEEITVVEVDSVTEVCNLPVEMADSVVPKKRKNIFQKIIGYFDDSNKTKEYKKFDWSIIGGPHYSSDTQFGIGLVAAGFYRRNLNDTLTRPSVVSLYGDICTVGFYLIGIKGTQILTGEKNRIDYNLYFYHFPRCFWGIGYDQGINMKNRSSFTESHVKVKVAFLHSLLPGLFLGPQLSYRFSDATKIGRPELFEGLMKKSSTYSVGAVFQYDTRDNLTAPEKGVLVKLEQNCSPRFLFNKQPFSSTEFSVSWYKHIWKGGIFAAQYRTKLCYGDVPWCDMATFGGSNNMRGYYDGRFRDKGEMDMTVELRQHVWRRNGIVVWAGAGTVYPKLSRFNAKHIVPNVGFGYRWEFKKKTNIRLDYGFGKGESSFLFSINEAF